MYEKVSFDEENNRIFVVKDTVVRKLPVSVTFIFLLMLTLNFCRHLLFGQQLVITKKNLLHLEEWTVRMNGQEIQMMIFSIHFHKVSIENHNYTTMRISNCNY